MPLTPITDPALERAEFKKLEKKDEFRSIVKYIYEEAVSVIKATDKKSYCYPFPTYPHGWGARRFKEISGWKLGLRGWSGPLKLSDDVSEIIDALKKLFPTAKIELKVYTCSGGKANNLNCKCGGHQNCISIDWSAT